MGVKAGENIGTSVYLYTNGAITCLVLSNDIVKHCCLSARHTELLLGDERPPSLISAIAAQWRSVYDNDSFHYVTKGAESGQPVGAPCYQWVGCRDHAGITCFPHSGSWQAQGGPAYICREQRKRVFYDMGPLTYYINTMDLKSQNNKVRVEKVCFFTVKTTNIFKNIFNKPIALVIMQI